MKQTWSDNKTANEIFSVIMMGNGPEEFESDFFEGYGEWTNPLEALTQWVKNNNVENFKIHLVKSDIEDLCTDCDSYIEDLHRVTDKEIIIHDDNEDGDYFGIYLDKLNITWDFEEWNYEFREDLKYNDKYFYSGSDGSIYTLIEKI